MKFKNSLAEILAEQNLKQADLCRMTGISTALMSNYMTGKASPCHDKRVNLQGAIAESKLSAPYFVSISIGRAWGYQNEYLW